MKYLGYTATDRITGFKGIITGFCAYVTGCSQYLLQPRMDAKGHIEESRWFDEQRLKIDTKKKPILLNNAVTPGPDKPAPRR